MASRDIAGQPAAQTAAPDAAGDDGFLIESHSVMDVADATPADTTEAAVAGAADQTTDADETVESAAADEPPAGVAGTDVESASAAGKPPAKGKPKGKEKHAPDARKQSIQSEIDSLTFRRKEEQRKFEEEEAERVRRRGARTTDDGKPPAAAVDDKKPAVAAEGPRPAMPKVKDFEDFDKYEEAMAAWNTADGAWLEKRDARLRTEIESGFDTRLKTDATTAAAQHRDQQLAARITAGKAKHADFAEKVTALKDLRSSWYKPEAHGPARTPFLSDLVANSDADPADLLYFMGNLATADPDRAQRLVDLFPSRALRDAMLVASSPIALLEHFSTEEGFQEFETIKGMHPQRQIMMLGALETRFADASSGPSADAVRPITQATPSAKPPAGSPRARESGPGTTQNKPFDFNEWMATEDAKDLAEKKTLLGTVG